MNGMWAPMEKSYLRHDYENDPDLKDAYERLKVAS